MRSVLLALGSGTLAVLTGCGFVGGALVGSTLDGDGFGFEGPDYYEVDSVGSWAGTGVVCLGSDATSLTPDAGYYEFEGSLVSDLNDTTDVGNLVPCVEDPARVLTLRTDAGEVIEIGYAWLSYDGWDSTPGIWLEEGTPLRVVIRQGDSEGTLSAGMAIFHEGQLLYALEAGHGEPALAEGDIPNLSYRSGDVVGQSDEDCGTRLSLTQEFISDEQSLTLYEGEDQPLSMDGEYYTTCSIASFAFEDGCDEYLSESSFVMFR